MAIVLNATAKALPFCNKASNELTNQQTHSVTSLTVPQVYMTRGVIHRTQHTVLPVCYHPSMDAESHFSLSLGS